MIDDPPGTPFGTVITAMVTPYNDRLEVDENRAADLAQRLVDMGSDGLLIGGTTGEAPNLSDDELVRLIQAVQSQVGERAFVWAGAGTNNTGKSIETSQKAVAAGAAGIMLVTPYYNKPPQQGLYAHFRSVAETIDVPVMVYNVPGRTSQNLEAETVGRLAYDVDNIVAIKEASGSMKQVSKLKQVLPDGFYLFSGDDVMTLPILALGGVGVVSVAAHLVAGDLREMIRTFQNGDVVSATQIHHHLYPLMEALFMTTNPIPVKAALRLQGVPVGGYRQPLNEPGEEVERQLRRVLQQLGLLDSRSG